MKYPENFYKVLDDIKGMRIRGAGRIARAAVNALKEASKYYSGESVQEYLSYIKNASKLLVSTRPTAVSLPNGLRYVLNRLFKDYESGIRDLNSLKNKLDEYVDNFIRLSADAIKKIGEYGSGRIEDGDIILTHCNSQAALSVIIAAFKNGKDVEVYATETRPRYQGRVTASILDKNGIKVTLIIDSAVRYFINKIDKVIVGADAIAANGAVINKIGTSQIALASYEARVPFMVAAETYKFSPDTLFGRLIKIEERESIEVVPRKWLIKRNNVRVRNPAFDITPPKYIDLIITEIGVVSPQAFPIIIFNRYGEFYRELEPWD